MTDEQICKTEWDRELEAAGYYTKDIANATDPKLIKILKHNRHDELADHAAKLAAWLQEHEVKEAKKMKV